MQAEGRATERQSGKTECDVRELVVNSRGLDRRRQL